VIFINVEEFVLYHSSWYRTNDLPLLSKKELEKNMGEETTRWSTPRRPAWSVE
jgi:hypothetical protein